MADTKTPNSDGTYQDNNGDRFGTSDGQPASHGQWVTLIKDNTTKDGIFDWNSGTVKEN